MMTATGFTKDAAMNKRDRNQSAAGKGMPAFHMNTRLIAAVQSRAGSHCHESANLLQSYYFLADVYKIQLRNGNATTTEAARRGVVRAEVRLREFLTDLSWNCRGDNESYGTGCRCQTLHCTVPA